MRSSYRVKTSSPTGSTKTKKTRLSKLNMNQVYKSRHLSLTLTYSPRSNHPNSLSQVRILLARDASHPQSKNRLKRIVHLPSKSRTNNRRTKSSRQHDSQLRHTKRLNLSWLQALPEAAKRQIGRSGACSFGWAVLSHLRMVARQVVTAFTRRKWCFTQTWQMLTGKTRCYTISYGRTSEIHLATQRLTQKYSITRTPISALITT